MIYISMSEIFHDALGGETKAFIIQMILCCLLALVWVDFVKFLCVYHCTILRIPVLARHT